MKRRTEMIMGVIAIVATITGAIWAIILSANYTPPEPEREIIMVLSKEKQDDGMYCYGSESYKICKPSFKYLVNGKRTSEKVFSSVEEGKTYSCEISSWNEWDKCAEVV